MQVVLTGGKGISMGTIGAIVCALAPAGGIAPLAGQVEYRWPISRGEESSGLPADDEVPATLLDGGGDLRGQARDLAVATPAAELLDAFRLAAGLPGWADRTCAAVEREIAAGQLGEASREWVTSALGGLPRLLLGGALRGRDAGPASTAETALMLIFIRNKVQDPPPARSRRELRRDGQPDGRAVLPGRLPQPLAGARSAPAPQAAGSLNGTPISQARGAAA